MDMNKFKKLISFSLMGMLMTQVVSAKEVLKANYHPTMEERLPADNKRLVGGNVTVTRDDVINWLQGLHRYKEMHPKLKKHVDQNKDNYRIDTNMHYILYRDNDAGYEIVMKHEDDQNFIALNRTYFRDPEDAAWDYKQTSAVNPKTKKPWISLDKKDIQLITKNTQQKLSEDDKAYLKDLLSILNENFHFLYGEKFVTMDNVKDPYEVLGKYQPPRLLIYDGFDDFLPPESDQKRELSKQLGRPLYHFYQGFDGSEPLNMSSNCLDKASVKVKLKDGRVYMLTYCHAVRKKDIDVNYQIRAVQVWLPKLCLEDMAVNLMNLMQEKGVDVNTLEGNSTPLTQALYLINLKTQNYIYTVVNSRYVLESDARKKNVNDFEGYKSLYEAVPLPKKLRPVKDVKVTLSSPAKLVLNNKFPERVMMCFSPVHMR